MTSNLHGTNRLKKRGQVELPGEDTSVAMENKQLFNSLKKSLSVKLQGQIFLAVCDDLQLRNRLAYSLSQELTGTKYHEFYSLYLNLHQPNLCQHIQQSLQKIEFIKNIVLHPVIGFQILGIEQITRQSATVQWSFLNNLANIDTLLFDLSSNILIWLTRPWLRTIEQSAPEFWQKQTGIFEFEGEPTPLPLFQPPLPPRPSAINLIARQTKAHQTQKNRVNFIAYPAIAQLVDLVLADINKSSRLAHNQKELTNYVRPLRILQSIQELSKDSHDDRALAIACHQLGVFYGDFIFSDQLPQKSHLKIAIQSYKLTIDLIANYLPNQNWDRSSHQLVSQLTQGELSLIKIWQDLGTFNWLLAKLPDQNIIWQDDHEEPFKLAIKFYRYCLMQYGISAETTTEIYKNLGNIYHELGQILDESKYFLLSIKAYKKVLSYAEKIADSSEYIATCNNLGTIYWHLAKYEEPCVNLQLAINAYNQAIQYAPLSVKIKKNNAVMQNLTAEQLGAEQLRYAMLNNNLGTAYLHLYQYQSESRWLFQAIKFYEIALEQRPPQQYPLPSAATYNNLGTAYWYLAESSDSNSNLSQDAGALSQSIMFWEQAIMAYTQTIHLTEQINDQANLGKISFDLLATKRQLGLAHYQIANLLPMGDHSDQQPVNRISYHLQRALYYQVDIYKALHLNNSEEINNCTVNNQTVNNQTVNKTAYSINNTNTIDIGDPDFSQIVRTIQKCYEKLGIAGQNQALSKVPPYLLPAIFTVIS